MSCGVSAAELSSARLISAKNLYLLPKNVKESVDLPDFIKESVSQTQILCTFQADFEACPRLSFHGRFHGA